MHSGLTVTLDDRQVLASLRRAIIMLGPEGSRGLMSGIGAYLRQVSLDTFRAQGPGWHPLAESTIMRRRDVRKAREALGEAKGKRARAKRNLQWQKALMGLRILEDTGDLRRSVAYDFSPTEVSIGTDKFHGMFHMEGTENMPARPFLKLDDAQERRIGSLIDRYLQKAFS